MNKRCVIVPLYKDFTSLTSDEKLSLEQLYKVLGKHPICLIGPPSVNWLAYTQHAEGFNISVNVKQFESSFFSGIQGYNKLLLSLKFYKAFSSYKYMLIYQTDAFVFRDELEYWCAMNYDYIGAPWFEDWINTYPGAPIIGVGNGGFSLRNIASGIKALRKFNLAKRIWGFYHSSFIRKYVSLMHVYRLLRLTLPKNAGAEIINFVFDGRYKINEDSLWGEYIPMFYPKFKVAPIKDAIKFSFEANAPDLFEMNDHKLPFGCHAWKRYESEFWAKYIR